MTRQPTIASSPRRHVPLRRGSKYTDILLQRLQNDVLKENKSGIIGVASHSPQQGVTTTALNLAIRAADHGFGPALAIDSNFQNQKLSRLYRASGNGISECLCGDSKLKSCVKKTKIEGLSVLGLGKTKLVRQMVIGTSATEDFINDLRKSYPFVVVDLPLVREPSFANTLLSQMDGILVVSRYGAKREHLETLQQNISDAGGRIVGNVMTGSQSKLPAWLNRFF